MFMHSCKYLEFILHVFYLSSLFKGIWEIDNHKLIYLRRTKQVKFQYYHILKLFFFLIFYLSHLSLFLSLNLLSFLLNLYVIFYLSLSVILNLLSLACNWVCINLGTNKVHVDSTLGFPSTLLLVTNLIYLPTS